MKKQLRRLERLGKFKAPERDERRRRRYKPSTLPETVSFTVGVPPGFEHLGLEGFRALLRERVELRLQELHELRRRLGMTRYLGAEAIKQQDPFASAGDTFPSFSIDPRIASLDKQIRIPLLLELKAWRAAYRAARALWAAGGEQRARAVFPYGTYLRRVADQAPVEEPPPGLVLFTRWAA